MTSCRREDRINLWIRSVTRIIPWPRHGSNPGPLDHQLNALTLKNRKRPEWKWKRRLAKFGTTEGCITSRQTSLWFITSETGKKGPLWEQELGLKEEKQFQFLHERNFPEIGAAINPFFFPLPRRLEFSTRWKWEWGPRSQEGATFPHRCCAGSGRVTPDGAETNWSIVIPNLFLTRMKKMNFDHFINLFWKSISFHDPKPFWEGGRGSNISTPPPQICYISLVVKRRFKMCEYDASRGSLVRL